MIDLKSYFHDKYQGGESFIENVILPIFGEDKYEDAYEEDVLENNPELMTMAQNTGVAQILRLGTIDIPMNPTDVFDITVNDHVQMKRNRVAVQQLIRRIMSTYSSAFMVFHYNDDDKWDWRFTFCSKQGNNHEFTDSKRYTFLLGPNQACRTAADNFKKLASKGGNIELSDIVKAFDVEALSDEFFDKYKEQYEKFVMFITGKRMVKVANKWEEKVIHEPCEEIMQGFAHFPNPEKAVRDYVKKLMGRLVFLHFLQKKGWLGVPVGAQWGEGDREFIQNLFAECEDKDHFIDNTLETLFNDLNTEREDDLSPLTSHHSPLKIPYLNGGLFERDATDETAFPLPAKYMESLLSFLASYNFTIDENDPDDAEVGVDPEMLGRIFENLLEDNKDKGAFYTPKEIVSYMCRESLIAYLQTDIEDEATKEAIRQFVTTHNVAALGTNDKFLQQVDEALKNVKICDPAIGSGAFPMGLLKELFQCRTALEGIDQSKAAEIKKHIIQQNIYGVDIERGAVDIARLRFWLSLIVDEETPQALPNLDYKIVEGNSLITTFDGQYIDLEKGKGEARFRPSLINIQREKKELQAEQKRFFTLSGEEKYRSEIAIKNHILNIIWYQLDFEKHSWQDATVEQTGLFGTTSSKGRKKNKAQVVEFTQERQDVLDKCEAVLKQINDENKTLKERACITIPFFEWETIFSDIFENESKKGFDIVIGNPPYVEAKKLKYIASTLKNKYNVYSGTADLSIYFAELGFKTLSDKGILSFITTNKFFNTGYGEKLRALLTSNTIRKIINFEQVEVFEDILVSSVVIEIAKSAAYKGNMFAYEKFYKLKKEDFIPQFIQKQDAFGTYSQDYLNEKEWSFSDMSELLLKEKIEKGATQLALVEGISINRGVTTGYNPAFIIDNQKKAELINQDSNSASIIKNMLQGRNIRKWYYNESDENLIFTRRGIDIEVYSAIKEHLYGYYKNLKPKKISEEEFGRKPGNYEWYEILDNTAYYREFERSEKIIWGLTADKWAFTIDRDQHYLPSNGYILTSTKVPIPYILGVLNSKLMHYYFHFIGIMTAGGAYTLKAATISSLPFKIAGDTSEIANIVNRILATEDKDHSSDVSKEESEIDRLVYQLYGLTDEEIKIVEGNN
jgi:hypothetical protein